MKTIRIGASTAAAVAAMTAGIALVAAPALASPKVTDNVTLCHATASATNPFVEETVDPDSIVRKSGHDSHEGDIIPAFDYADGSYPGKNLDQAALLDSGCQAIEESPTTEPTTSTTTSPTTSTTTEPTTSTTTSTTTSPTTDTTTTQPPVTETSQPPTTTTQPPVTETQPPTSTTTTDAPKPTQTETQPPAKPQRWIEETQFVDCDANVVTLYTATLEQVGDQAPKIVDEDWAYRAPTDKECGSDAVVTPKPSGTIKAPPVAKPSPHVAVDTPRKAVPQARSATPTSLAYTGISMDLAVLGLGLLAAGAVVLLTNRRLVRR